MPEALFRPVGSRTSSVAPGPLPGPVQHYTTASLALNTRRAYSSDLRHFDSWCRAHGFAAGIPCLVSTIALYISDLADSGAAVSTIQRRLSAIAQAHRLANCQTFPTRDRTIRATMTGIRRTRGTAPTQKAALLTADLRLVLATTDASTPAGARDRALLLLGFAGGLRRSELVALEIRDIEETPDGLHVLIRRSKTDQEGAGRTVGIPWGQHPETCPIRALRAWTVMSDIGEGPVFRAVDRHGRIGATRLSDRGVARIVQRAAGRAGLEASQYAGHSLRAGLATAAAAGGASERAIMAQTGHRSVMTVRRYIRAGSLFQENAAAATGL